MQRRRQLNNATVVAVIIALALAARPCAAAEDASPSRPDFPSPFGPPYDPTRPPPTEPETKGRGIVEAKLIASGAVEIAERRADSTFPKLAGVVLDMRIAADSVTDAFGSTSVTATTEDGTAPLFAMCTPNAPDPLSVYRIGEARINQWHVAVGGAPYDCSERNARLATIVTNGSMRLLATAEWQGPLVLMFEADPKTLRKVKIPGAEVELPPSKEDPAGGAGTDKKE